MLSKKQIADVKSMLDEDSQGFPLAFQALGDPGRFHIFRILMYHRDICVTDIAHIFGITVSAASQQLRVLERLGLILKVRMGQMVCYEMNSKNQITEQLIKLLSAKSGTQRARAGASGGKESNKPR